jgi:Tfp pilus assembly protein PilN
LRIDGSVDQGDKRFGSMTIMHMALGALSSIFGAHLSWTLTDWIIERKRSGRPVFWPALVSVVGVAVLVVALGVLLSQASEV